MASLKAHFDGHSIVLDEPATLAVGQAVLVLVEASSSQKSPQHQSDEFDKEKFKLSFTPHTDPTAALMHGEDFDERDALHIDPLDAVSADFVRQPGSGAGEIKMADDFDETPVGFKDYRMIGVAISSAEHIRRA